MSEPEQTPPDRGRARVDSLRDTYRQQMLDSIGGWTGALITAIPTAVFVIVNVTADLRAAIIAAVASALVLTGYRFARKQPIQQALSGLLGVAVAAFIAARTGQARGYFLFGIWTSFAYAVPFGISLLVRRPLIGVLWEFLDPTPGTAAAADGKAQDRAKDRVEDHADAEADVHADAQADGGASSADAAPGAAGRPAGPPWYRRRPLLVAYSWATLAATAVFLARGIVQLTLYGDNRTGWLAFARIAMGYPLFIAAVGLSFLVITRARRRMQVAGG